MKQLNKETIDRLVDVVVDYYEKVLNIEEAYEFVSKHIDDYYIKQLTFEQVKELIEYSSKGLHEFYNNRITLHDLERIINETVKRINE